MRKAKDERKPPADYWRLINQSLTFIYEFMTIHNCFKNQYFCLIRYGVGC
nr:MAG TPA: hypothetical protein [Caudoviricetes sp.]